MNDFKINKLSSAGAELFEDKESFLNDLTEQELLITKGGDNKVRYFDELTPVFRINSVDAGLMPQITRLGGAQVSGVRF
jgi:hypothetical protein